MKTQKTLTLLSLATALIIHLPHSASAAVQVVGVNSPTDGDYAADASAIDLINADAATLASEPTYSATPHFGGSPSNPANDGTVGTANVTGDITFWLRAEAGSTYSITYTLDTSVNTLGYDINSIQTIHGWTNNSGNQKNQNYIVDVSTVDNASFSTIATVAYLPFTSEGNTASTKVTVTEDATGILASGVNEIRFTYTVPASAGGNPSPTIREIDVFGVPSGGSPFTITQITYDPDLDTVTLTWPNTGAAFYIASLSYDLTEWDEDFNNMVLPGLDEDTADTEHITVTFPLVGDSAEAKALFFRIAEG